MCERVKLPGGGFAIVCGGRHSAWRRRSECWVPICGRESEYQCDWKMGGKTKAGKFRTCDRHICKGHALEVAPDKHLCPDHQKAYADWQAKRAIKAAAA